MSEELPRNFSERLPSSEALKKDLLERSLSLKLFLSELFKLDQSTPDRRNCTENLQALLDPEVLRIVSENPEQHFQYENLVSISYVHQGQIQAEQKAYPEALESFKNALAAANTITETEVEDYQGWKDYIAGTVAYFERDLPKLKAIHAQMEEEGRNKYILESFIKQLEEGSDLDYIAALVAAKR